MRAKDDSNGGMMSGDKHGETPNPVKLICAQELQPFGRNTFKGLRGAQK